MIYMYVLFDSTLFLIPHITAITTSANYHIFRIRKIRKSITLSLKPFDNFRGFWGFWVFWGFFIFVFTIIFGF